LPSPKTSTSAKGSSASPAGVAAGRRPPSSTGSLADRPRGRSSIAAVTSTSGGSAPARGTSTLTRVVIVCPPNRKTLVGADCGRRAASCSRVPKKSAWLGQTVAHMGFLPTDERS
jgi:hypothetical protein